NYLGCDSVVTVTVGELPVSSSTKICNVCPGTTYFYGGVELSAGDIQDFVLTNYLGCDSVVTVKVFEKKTSAEIQTVKVCPGEVYNFNGTGIAPGETREFHFLGFEGCDSIVTISVTAWPALDFEVKTDSSCTLQPTGTLQINVTPGGSLPTGFSLDSIDFQAEPHFEFLSGGEYKVFVQDENYCIFSQSVTVPTWPVLQVSLPWAYFIPCDSAFVTITPSIQGDTVGLQRVWWNGATTASVQISEPGNIWLQFSNKCETVITPSQVFLADSEGDTALVYVPNTFAPSAELSENAMFRPFFAKNLSPLSYRLEVYDRWGNFVFSSELPEDGWKGLFHDKMVDPGVYTWLLKARVHFCGRVVDIQRSGDVTVVR
ncbi:MAG TPA: gliding motility-associated C-terminal domain-containing protein, partial [Saprospiraceae bacterium]|nr:gliding motility-associated C-terminal domain-containing protein [Saprospiraceae bacterium]